MGVCEGRYKFSDLAPEGGADQGPLAPCGETRAALDILEKLTPAARTQLSSLMNPPVHAPRSLPVNQHLYPNQGQNGRIAGENPPSSNLRSHAPSHLKAALQAQERRLSESPPPCSTQRASCRHYIALHEQAESKQRVAARRRRQHATR